MTKLVINSDDFGYSKAINLGIIESFNKGVLTSTTLMANMPGFREAVKLAKEHNKLGIGVHLSMTCGKPLLSTVDDLVSNSGEFKPLSVIKEKPEATNLEQLYAEWKSQIEKVLSTGLTITHLDSHHYTHSMGNHYQVIEQLSIDFDVPVRNCFDVKSKFSYPNRCPMDSFWNLFNYPEIKDMSQKYQVMKPTIFTIIEKEAQKYRSNNQVEAVCHPGYLDETCYFGSSFNLARMREVNILCDKDFKKLLDYYGYELCHYGNL